MLTLPNILTLSRIVTVPLLAAFLWWPEWRTGYAVAFAIYCLMGVTDYFDGYLARAQGTVSKLGIFLDPIADKIMRIFLQKALCCEAPHRYAAPPREMGSLTLADRLYHLIGVD